MLHEKATGADEFVDLRGKNLGLKYLAGEVGAGKFDGVCGVNVLVEERILAEVTRGAQCVE
ncbi:hypothetical protein AWC03_24710 [Mycobacterium europaeum]|nr:hypothetical protein AWC03_24710 [Mycobacterium europaeum]